MEGETELPPVNPAPEVAEAQEGTEEAPAEEAPTAPAAEEPAGEPAADKAAEATEQPATDGATDGAAADGTAAAEPPAQASNQAPAKEEAPTPVELLRLFVGGLPHTCQDADLQEQFSKFGPLRNASLLRDATGGCSGAAFVTFDKKEDAEAAIAALDGKSDVMPGSTRPMEVRYAKRPLPPKPAIGPNDKQQLFFNGVPPVATEKELEEFFSTYGKVARMELFTDSRTQRSRGCGFVFYKERAGALEALEKLGGGGVNYPGGGGPVSLRWADPEPSRPDRKRKAAEADLGGPGSEDLRQLFIAKITRSIPEEEIRGLMVHYGDVERINMFKPTPEAVYHKGCGVVTFNKREEAEAAMRALDEVYIWPGMKEPMIAKYNESEQNKRRREEEMRMGPNFVSMEQPPPGCDMDSLKLYVGNLPPGCTETDVHTVFKGFGRLMHVELLRQKHSGEPKGSAYLWFQKRREADLAMRRLNGSTTAFREIAVWRAAEAAQAAQEAAAAAGADGGEAAGAAEEYTLTGEIGPTERPAVEGAEPAAEAAAAPAEAASAEGEAAAAEVEAPATEEPAAEAAAAEGDAAATATTAAEPAAAEAEAADAMPKAAAAAPAPSTPGVWDKALIVTIAQSAVRILRPGDRPPAWMLHGGGMGPPPYGYHGPPHMGGPPPPHMGGPPPFRRGPGGPFPPGPPGGHFGPPGGGGYGRPPPFGPGPGYGPPGGPPGPYGPPGGGFSPAPHGGYGPPGGGGGGYGQGGYGGGPQGGVGYGGGGGPGGGYGGSPAAPPGYGGVPTYSSPQTQQYGGQGQQYGGQGQQYGAGADGGYPQAQQAAGGYQQQAAGGWSQQAASPATAAYGAGGYQAQQGGQQAAPAAAAGSGYDYSAYYQAQQGQQAAGQAQQAQQAVPAQDPAYAAYYAQQGQQGQQAGYAAQPAATGGYGATAGPTTYSAAPTAAYGTVPTVPGGAALVAQGTQQQPVSGYGSYPAAAAQQQGQQAQQGYGAQGYGY